MELTEKAAYIKGLMDGLQIDESTGEGKVLRAVSDLLCEVTAAVAELDSDMSTAYEQIDDLEEAVDDLSDVLFDGLEDDEDEDDGDQEDYGEQYELTCPKCGTKNLVDEETLMSEDLYCANCGAQFSIEFEDEDEGEGDGAQSGENR